MAKTLREQKINQIIYISLGGAIAIIILFIILFNAFSGKDKSDNNVQIAQNGNEQNSSEQANSSIGKTVEESKQSGENNDESVKVQVSKENDNSQYSEELKEENNISNKENSDTNKTSESTQTANNIQNSEDIKNSTNELNSADEEDIETSNVIEEEKDPTFGMPVKGEIAKHFGKDKLIYSDTLKEWTTHLGIDIKADKTTVVKASADGTVKSIKNDPRYGLTIVVEHTKGFVSVYSNLLTAEFVVEGESVKAGQTLGTVGNTATFEILDDSHLHFEILKDGNAVDPEMYLK